MSNIYFFTGFPGFIASAMINQLVRDDNPVTRIYALVQEQMLQKANQEAIRICEENGLNPEMITLVVGDITREGLGLDEGINTILTHSVTHVFHLAAVYDLAVAKDVAYRVNVVGTKNVNDWVLTLKKLVRYTYFSTAFVSGLREGTIYETELDMKQSFKNHYESTKFEAEVLVNELKSKVPVTIIRPGVVRGHSKTGETIKFDGPYFIFNFFNRLKWLPFLPYLGKGEAEGNFVPVDYVFDATLYLSHSEKGEGKTYHLTDPNPFSVNELYRMIYEEMKGRSPKGRIPLSWAKGALRLSSIRKFLGVEKEAMDYFTCKSKFDCSQAKEDLSGTAIICPDFKASLKSMVSYYEMNKRDKNKHVKII